MALSPDRRRGEQFAPLALFHRDDGNASSR